MEEVIKAIRTIENGKAPGSDQVHAEMLKVEDVVLPGADGDPAEHLGDKDSAQPIEYLFDCEAAQAREFDRHKPQAGNHATVKSSEELS